MALVLNRKRGESIIIDNTIIVTVIEADRGRATIAVTAPECVKIMREELIGTEPKPRAGG